MEISCEAGTEMKLFTQSYNKIHPMPTRAGARQQLQVTLQSNALLQYVPHPAMPYAGSIFRADNRIDLPEDAHLIWGDLLSGGRIHSGERFDFTSYRSLTRIFRQKKLLLYDLLQLQPGRQPVEDLLFFEGYTHQAAFVVISPYAGALKAELDELLTEQPDDMTYGFTSCCQGGLLLRALAYSGDGLYEWLLNLSAMCWDFITFHRNRQPAAIEKAGPPVEAAGS